MGVPGLGVKSEQQLPAYTTATAPIQSLPQEIPYVRGMALKKRKRKKKKKNTKMQMEELLSVLVSYEHCNKWPHTLWLKPHKLIILQFWKSEVQNVSHWSKIKVLAGSAHFWRL